SNFVHLDNILFTYTNRSSSVALLGCPTINDIGSYTQWGEIELEDVASLMLPDLKSNDSFVAIRGLGFAPGTEKQFQFPPIVKGGPDRHFVLTYNSMGHLNLFMCDFESAENSTFLRMP